MTGQPSPDPHKPVLLAEVLAVLEPRDDALYVDATFGAGGYTRAILAAANCRVVAIDRDPEAIETARALAAKDPSRLTVIEGRFSEMDPLILAEGETAVDGVALDIGVSSMQLDRAERGFSFRHDGPLDMRMGAEGPTAAEVVNETPEGELADIIYRYGEERLSRRIAKAIAEARRAKPLTRTQELAEIVRKAVKAKPGAKIDPATRTFQALRIFVNDELGELERGLAAAERLLKPEGRLAVVSFHSLEDRVVKRFLSRRAKAAPRPSRHLPAAEEDAPKPSFRLLTKRPVTPDAAEVEANPRARSARLRAAERLDAPAWPVEEAA